MSSQLPGGVPDPGKIEGTRPVQPNPSPMPDTDKFSSYMNTSGTEHAPNALQQPSPMDLQGKLAPPTAPPTMQAVQEQMRAVSGTLGDVKNQLHTKGLNLKQSQKYLVRNKLTSANENLRSAAERAGVDTGPPVDLSTKRNPIAKFLELVSDGQRQMNAATEQVKELSKGGKSINAGQLLLVQSKLQKAQQELEYTSVLLGKAVEMIKTLFNVQI